MKQRRIEAFRAVMMSGSFTHAANQLGITQPAVSRLVADFEAEIGLRLFVRAGGNITATEEARILLDEVNFFFRGLEGVYQSARDIKEMRKGQIRIAAMPNLSLEVVPELTRSFLEKHDDIRLTVDVLTSPQIADLVASRHFDLGFAQLADNRPDIRVLASYRLKCVCVFSEHHRLAGLSEVTPADLSDEPVVALSRHTLVAHHIKQTFLRSNVPLNSKVESQPSYAACALAVKGVGVAIVDSLTAEFFGPNRLVAKPFIPEIPFDFRLIQAVHSMGNRVCNSFAAHSIEWLDDMANVRRI